MGICHIQNHRKDLIKTNNEGSLFALLNKNLLLEIFVLAKKIERNPNNFILIEKLGCVLFEKVADLNLFQLS